MRWKKGGAQLDGVTMVTYKPGHKLHCTESVESTDFFFGGGQPFIVGTSQGKQQLCVPPLTLRPFVRAHCLRETTVSN